MCEVINTLLNEMAAIPANKDLDDAVEAAVNAYNHLHAENLLLTALLDEGQWLANQACQEHIEYSRRRELEAWVGRANEEMYTQYRDRNVLP